MNSPHFTAQNRRTPSRKRLFALLSATACTVLLAAALAASDQPSDDNVGVIEGDNISINGPMSVESVAGQIKTVLRSGSDVRVKGGQAKISLVEGGQISICGPAHLSVLKSSGSLTVALDSGIVRIRVDRDPGLAIYTPQIQAKPVAIGDDPREVLVGFENPGLMCIRTYRGAMRLEQQLGGESVMVPQGGDVLLTNGQFETMRTGEGHCRCELQIAKTAPLPSAPVTAAGGTPPGNVTADPPSDSAQVLSASGEASTAASEKSAPNDDRIYQVDMPPLVYNATAKVQFEPDPRIMVIVRRVRVRPTLIFQGRVEAATEKPSVANAIPAAPSAAVASPIASPTKTPPPLPSFSDRMRSFFRNLLTHNP